MISLAHSCSIQLILGLSQCLVPRSIKLPISQALQDGLKNSILLYPASITILLKVQSTNHLLPGTICLADIAPSSNNQEPNSNMLLTYECKWATYMGIPPFSPIPCLPCHFCSWSCTKNIRKPDSLYVMWHQSSITNSCPWNPLLVNNLISLIPWEHGDQISSKSVWTTMLYWTQSSHSLLTHVSATRILENRDVSKIAPCSLISEIHCFSCHMD